MRDWGITGMGLFRRFRLCLSAGLAICMSCAAGRAAAQNFTVGTFRPWAGYAIPNGLWLPGETQSDGRGDIVHAVQGTDYVHVWRSDGAGAFDVKTFRPWAGYAIPNGLWLPGDYDGDGRGDILHAVEGKDYAHVWLSTGDGKFAVSTFRPWPGYAIPNGQWLAGDFNGDGRADVLHAVEGKDYVHTWLSRGDGTFNVASFRPWSGYAIPNGIWLAGDYNGDGRSDIVHAVQGTDYVHTWLSKGDGTYDVSSFRPWSGYAIPNGIWLAGDYNGDGRSDIVHAVQGTDYVHPWLSNGDGSFNVSAFRPWAGYAIPNGEWLTGDYNGDGRTDIVHAVQGTDYVHPWLSNGDGTFSVSVFRPWAGYAIPNGVWFTSDFNGDGRTDIIHAVQGKDYVHTWASTPPSPNPGVQQVAIEAIEATQAIQDPAGSVAMIAEKETFVRAYLSAGSDITVDGTLTITDPATGASWAVPSMGNARLTTSTNGNLRVKRETLARSLNFRLPAAAVRAGLRSASLTTVATTAGVEVPCTNCRSVSRTIKLVPSTYLRLRLVALTYTTGTPPSPVTVNGPSPRDLALLESWLRRAMPAGRVIVSTATIASGNAWPFTCNDANAELAALRATEVAGGTDGRTHYYAMVADAGGFMRGCASGVPNAPDPTVVASGPTGAAWTGDADGSYGDWYGGHELSHTFGRRHPGFCSETKNDLTGYPFPNGQLSYNDGNFTGFDVGDDANSIAARPLSGVTSFENMTYCAQPQWPSAYTYQGVRARINLENPAYSADPASPGSLGAPAPLARGKSRPWGAGYPDLRRLAAAGAAFSSGEGFNEEPPQPMLPKRPEPRNGRLGMPPINPGLPAPPRLVAARAAPPPAPPPALSGKAVAPPPRQKGPVIAEGMPQEGENAPADEAKTRHRLVEVREGAYLSVIATVNLTKASAKITAVNRVRRATVPTQEQNGRAVLRLLDGAGARLQDIPVWLREDTDIEKGADQTALVDAIVPFTARIGGIELVIDGKPLTRVRASKSPPRIKKVRIGDTGILNGGPARSDAAVTVSWSSVDDDKDSLTYRVEVSSDSGRSWNVAAVSVKDTLLTIPRSMLARTGARPLVRVIANDGWHVSPPATAK